MWQIVNRTPYSAAQGWVRGLEGAETWLVVVKATFDIAPDGTTRIAAEQPPPVRSPVYWGEPGMSSIRYDTDFVLAKQTTDVIVNGAAHAPRGTALRQLDVSLRVGDIRKNVRVFGNRFWGVGAAWITAPEPFESMPLRFEHAFGGIDPKSGEKGGFYWPNPVGTGFATTREHAANSRLPNLELVDAPIRSWDDRPAPAGFGVVASHWQSRAQLAGTYDAAWEGDRQPLLPHDFRIEHYQTSPRDQRPPSFLRGGELVVCRGMTPNGELSFQLPRVELALRSRFHGGDRVDHPPPMLHTVIIEPDAPRVSMVWHMAYECHARVYQLERTQVHLREEQPSLQDEDAEALLGF
jgi:hypothetical protein